MPAPSRPQRSFVVWRTADGSGDTPADILRVVIKRLRAENSLDGAREISVALQRCEEGLLWLQELERRRESQHGLSNGT
jgi:hypothetical protein